MSKKDDLLPKVDKNGNVIPLAEASMVKFRRPFQHKLARYPAHVRGGVRFRPGRPSARLPGTWACAGRYRMPAENPADGSSRRPRPRPKLMEEAQANIEDVR